MKAFFDHVRRRYGPLSQGQVEGFNTVLKASEGQPLSWRAYMLATVWHETAKTMQPIAEYGKGKGRKYGQRIPPYNQAYYGRGYVQLTWDYNYINATKRLKAKGLLARDADLLKTPELAMVPAIAAAILVHGMVEGWFTGKSLSTYGADDYVSMRRIINGTDRAVLIASHAIVFEDALEALTKAPAPVAPSTPVQPAQAPVAAPVGFWKRLFAAFGIRLYP